MKAQGANGNSSLPDVGPRPTSQPPCQAGSIGDEETGSEKRSHFSKATQRGGQTWGLSPVLPAHEHCLLTVFGGVCAPGLDRELSAAASPHQPLTCSTCGSPHFPGGDTCIFAGAPAKHRDLLNERTDEQETRRTVP